MFNVSSCPSFANCTVASGVIYFSGLTSNSSDLGYYTIFVNASDPGSGTNKQTSFNLHVIHPCETTVISNSQLSTTIFTLVGYSSTKELSYVNSYAQSINDVNFCGGYTITSSEFVIEGNLL